jgi:uncharacterized protein (DUF4415 family)
MAKSKNFDFKKSTDEARKIYREKAFMDDSLDEEEQMYEKYSGVFIPMDNQNKYRAQLIEAARKNVEIRRAKRPITINLDSDAIGYFKELAQETGISYQNLINLYLLQCAKEKKRIEFI